MRLSKESPKNKLLNQECRKRGKNSPTKARNSTRKRKAEYRFMQTIASVDRELQEEQAFREQCRRQMARPLASRMKYGFCRVYRPILDEPGVRSFASTAEYRQWCADHLPPFLGFQPAS